jgi:hypothetical protein
MPENSSTRSDREANGFQDSAKRAFEFLRDFGYELVHSEPTMIRYEGDQRYVQIYHGRRSYELGVDFGRTDEPENATSLRELVNSLNEREKYRGYTATSAEAVAKGVKLLASDTRRFEDVLRGNLPHERLERYRRALTDYYSGKSKISPDRGHLP